jgi:hypothetical protein
VPLRLARAHENDWIVRGRVIAFKPLINPLSGTELYWVYLDLDRLKLEVLVNARALTGARLQVGATISAEVWLQGHVLDSRALRQQYEAVDQAYSIADLLVSLPASQLIHANRSRLNEASYHHCSHAHRDCSRCLRARSILDSSL